MCDLLLRAFMLVSPKCLLAAQMRKLNQVFDENRPSVQDWFHSTSKCILIQGQTFSKLNKIKHLVSTVHNFLPKPCNKYSSLKRKISIPSHIRRNYPWCRQWFNQTYLQALMNLKFLILHSKKIIYFFIVNFHVGNTNQKLPIWYLNQKSEDISMRYW